MSAVANPISAPQYVDYTPRGACRDLFRHKESQIVIAGPAGTGKSRGSLELFHAVAEKYPKARLLIVRKTRASLNNTALVTYENKVLEPSMSALGVRFHTTEQEYQYSNGSIIGIAGMDKSSKIMSSEYDMIYVQECTELTEDDWEMLFTRIRNNATPRQQLIGDCNPGPPTHWIKKRSESGKLTLLESRHEDNPALWDAEAGRWTDQGVAYVQGKLDSLTGVRYSRLRLGLWASAEGIIFDNWDRSIHIVDGALGRAIGEGKEELFPADWPCYWVIDFGYTNPFVWQEWRQDPDGRLYRATEIYRTKTIVEDHVKAIKAAVGRLQDGPWTPEHPCPRAVICDHDAEDRATFETHMKLPTISAYKAVSPGLQAVQVRLRKAGDGKPRLMFMRDALTARDGERVEAAAPCCTEEEVEGYIWDPKFKKGEQPLKKDDHGCDATRYLVAYVDDIEHNQQLGFNEWMERTTEEQIEAKIKLLEGDMKKIATASTLTKPTKSDNALVCPKCKSDLLGRLPMGQGYRCNSCGEQFGSKDVSIPSQSRGDLQK